MSKNINESVSHDNTLTELKQAEEESAKTLASSREDKQSRIKVAGEKAKTIRESAAKEADALKNDILAKARKETAKQESSIISSAEKEASAIRKKKISDANIEAVFEKIVEEFDA